MLFPFSDDFSAVAEIVQENKKDIGFFFLLTLTGNLIGSGLDYVIYGESFQQSTRTGKLDNLIGLAMVTLLLAHLASERKAKMGQKGFLLLILPFVASFLGAGMEINFISWQAIWNHSGDYLPSALGFVTGILVLFILFSIKVELPKNQEVASEHTTENRPQ